MTDDRASIFRDRSRTQVSPVPDRLSTLRTKQFGERADIVGAVPKDRALSLGSGCPTNGPPRITRHTRRKRRDEGVGTRQWLDSSVTAPPECSSPMVAVDRDANGDAAVRRETGYGAGGISRRIADDDRSIAVPHDGTNQHRMTGATNDTPVCRDRRCPTRGVAPGAEAAKADGSLTVGPAECLARDFEACPYDLVAGAGNRTRDAVPRSTQTGDGNETLARRPAECEQAERRASVGSADHHGTVGRNALAARRHASSENAKPDDAFGGIPSEGLFESRRRRGRSHDYATIGRDGSGVASGVSGKRAERDEDTPAVPGPAVDLAPASHEDQRT